MSEDQSRTQQEGHTETYSFLRPLLAADQRWAAFAWLRSGLGPVAAADVAQSFREADLASLAKRSQVLVPIEAAWLHDEEFLKAFPAAQTVFVLPCGALLEQATSRQCASLRKRGWHLACEVDNAQAIESVSSAACDYLKVDAAFARYDLSVVDLFHLTQTKCRLIADNVGSFALFEWLQKRNFALCDSTFVAIVDPTVAHASDPAKGKVLKLLSLVMQDADTRVVEQVFREEPRLAYNLLRLVNSVALSAKTKVASLQQAITLLGRRQLQRWLQLLVYADHLSQGNRPNPLLQLAAARGRQMELLSSELASPGEAESLADAAFMTGIFSLLDVLFRMPINEVVTDLPLPEAIAGALANRAGQLGEMLAALVAGEMSETAGAAAMLERLGIGAHAHALAQRAAFIWASQISVEAG